MPKLTDNQDLKKLQDASLKKLFPAKPRIMVGMGTCGIGNGADKVFEAIKNAVKTKKVDCEVVPVGCFGFCSKEPIVSIYQPKKPILLLHDIALEDVDMIINIVKTQTLPSQKILGKIEEWDFLTRDIIKFGKDFAEIPNWNEVDFYKWQKKIVLRDCGFINPGEIDEYIAVGGYQALATALNQGKPEEVINTVKASNLRGRGGAGFSTGLKWQLMRNVKSDKKYIICNADEGDPGAYMNRNEIESDPHMLIEGMIIGAYAMGADEGIIYARAEYPLAVERLKNAIEQARSYGIIGKKIFGSQFDFELTLVEGAGAFVCGEETALIASIENKAGRPRPRPPFPAEKGLWGKPTTINNVESWCNIPVIVLKGADWFKKTGTAKSAGTKVFSLVGKVKHTGLVELPFGQPLEVVLYNIGGGSSSDKKIKAVQLGGPSGGCVPPEHFNVAVDYESLTELGAIVGSGGMVVMDEYNCMVDVARYFIEFTSSESCGKCVPCRIGLKQAFKILNNITLGKANEQDIAKLEQLAINITKSSLCGLGQTAPNPVLTTLRYFKNEYLNHIYDSRCEAGICKELYISPCENSCYLHVNIPGFLSLIQDDREQDAYQLFVEQNPFPATTGRVCQAQCNTLCRRAEIDGAVNQKEVHRYLADKMAAEQKDIAVFKNIIARKLPYNGKKVAIIGAGPAGLTAAFYLAQLGYETKVYDALPEPGGMLRYAIPEYRLPKKVLDHEISLVQQLGVELKQNMKVGIHIQLNEIINSYDAVFLSIGVWAEVPLNIPGLEFPGVYHSFKVLEEIAAGKDPHFGENVVVIGGGNAAIDSARSAKRLGKHVTIVYRRERQDMPAFAEEIEAAHEEGIEFVFLAAPKAILGKGEIIKALQVEIMKLGDYDRSGRRKPVPTGNIQEISCDNVILAIGEKVDSGFIKKAGISVEKDGRVIVDPFTLQTNNPKIFAGGDLVTGPSTVSQAMAAGKQFARELEKNQFGLENWNKLFSTFKTSERVPSTPEGGQRRNPEELPIPDRSHNFHEVNLGYCQDDMKCEASRCLRCDIKRK